jgi:hypothetical protein
MKTKKCIREQIFVELISLIKETNYSEERNNFSAVYKTME